MLNHLLLFILLLLPLSEALAINLKVGDTLPTLVINDQGEALLDKKGKPFFEPWNSNKLLGEKRVIQYLPARFHQGRVTMNLIDTLYELEYPHSCRTANIIDASSAIPGTEFIALQQARSYKKKTPLCKIMYDALGIGKAIWGFPNKLAVVLVVDENLKILYIVKGKPTEQDIKKIIELST